MQGLHLQNYASLLEQIPPVYQPTLKHFIVIRFWFLVTHRIFKSFDESDLNSCNVFFFTGLSNIIRKIVLEQLGYFMVLPNKITVPLSDKVDTKDLKCPDYAGVLRWDSTKYVYFSDITSDAGYFVPNAKHLLSFCLCYRFFGIFLLHSANLPWQKL